MKKVEIDPDNIGKYIPPHKRKPKIQTSESNTISGQMATNFESLSLSNHAVTRIQQRYISQRSLEEVFQEQNKSSYTESIIYIDEDIKMVTSCDHKVITALHNAGNTKFDLLAVSNKRKEYLLREVNHNNDHAMCELAELYLNEELGQKEVSKAYYLLIKAANMNNSHAMVLLSQLYEDGDLGEDVQVAQEWMEKAARHNNKYALAILGQKYLKEYLSIQRNPDISEKEQIILLKKSKIFLQRAANGGSKRAMWIMGKIYEEGYGGEKNLSLAIELYSKAARVGSPYSIESLNSLVLQGEINEEVFENILSEVSSFVAKTNSEMAVTLGLQQIDGLLGKNSARGFAMLEQAAEKRNENAIKALAKCYRGGRGCVVDLQLAKFWFKKLHDLYCTSAELGNLQSLYKLGKLFLKNDLGSIDLSKAEEIFIRLANTQDPDYMFNLGNFYIEGRLGNQDPAQGVQLVEQAITIWEQKALAGNIDAIEQLIEIYSDEDLGFKDRSKLIKWLLKKNKNDEEKLSLVTLLLTEQPKKEDVIKAVMLIEEIIDHSSLFSKIKALKLLKDHKQLIESIFAEKPNGKEFLLNFIKTSEQDLYKIFINDAEKGDQDIILMLATSYSGKGRLSLSIDYNQAAKWYKVLVNLGTTNSLYALIELTKMSKDGHLSKGDEPSNTYWLEQLQEYVSMRGKQEYRAALSYGILCKEGKLFPKNFMEAAKWLNIAMNLADQGKLFRKADYHFKDLLGLSELTLEDKQQIIQGVIDAALQINQEKPYRIGRILGDLYSKGDFIEANYKEAYYWYEKSALLENSIAMFRIGNLYQTGAFGGSNLSMAIDWYNKSAERGNQESIKFLITLKDLSDLNISEQEIVKFWQTKGERELTPESSLTSEIDFTQKPKDPSIMYSFGKAYKHGDGITADPILAAFWFRKAFKKEHIASGLELREMYNSGELGDQVKPVAIYIDQKITNLKKKLFF